MTPERFAEIRRRSGHSIRSLADALGMSDERAIRRFESGEKAVTGPVSILMELIAEGRV